MESRPRHHFSALMTIVMRAFSFSDNVSPSPCFFPSRVERSFPKGQRRPPFPYGKERQPDMGSPAAVFLVQIVFLADAFFVVFVPPMQLVDAVHQPFVIAFLNSVDDEGVFLHGGQIPFAHKIFARKIPQAVLDGREDTLGEDIGGNFKKTL